MKKSRKILIILLVLISFGCYRTYTNFTTSSKTTNVITSGFVDLQLIQKTVDENGTIIDLENNTITNITPDSTFTQIPYVKNIGTEDCYARMKLDINITAKDGTPLLDELSFNIDKEKWILDSDGWYRYKDIVKVNEVIKEPLFTEVYFSKDMDNKYIESSIKINIKAQAVQSEYNEYTNSVLEVIGWSDNTVSEVDN